MKYQDTLYISDAGAHYAMLSYCPYNKEANIANKAKFANEISAHEPHIIINGKMTFLNTHGHLNAEQYPYLKSYLLLSMLYILVGAVWLFFNLKYKEHLIRIHHAITAIFVISMIEFILTYVDFDRFNSTGRRNYYFLGVNVTLNVVRNTAARVFALLVSLGFGITRHSVAEFHAKIAILAFLFFVSDTIYMVFLYLNHYIVLRKSILLIASLPISIVNTVFFYWIIVSLLSTLKLLSDTKQRYKHKLIRRFFLTLLVALIIALVAIIAQFTIALLGSRDRAWNFNFLFEIVWSMIFSGSLFVIMYILKPNRKSKMLAFSEELQEETF